EAPVRAERKRARGDVSRRTDARAGLCAPDAHAALDVVAEDERTVGAESRAFHRVRVIENVEGLPIRAEDPRGAVVARRQHEPPVTAEGRGTNRLPGSRKEAKLGRRARIPDARGSVGARRRYSPPAGAERGRDDRVGVAAEDGLEPAGRGFPDPRGAVGARCDEELAVGAERGAVYGVDVTEHQRDAHPGPDVADAGCAV